MKVPVLSLAEDEDEVMRVRAAGPAVGEGQKLGRGADRRQGGVAQPQQLLARIQGEL